MDPRSTTPRAPRPLLPTPRPSVVLVVAKIPYDSVRPHAVTSLVATAIRTALGTRESLPGDPPPSDDGASPPQRLDVVAIGPGQINWLDEASGLCTVTYPAGSTTVLSVQPDGAIDTRPQGTAGPYERGICKPDRVIFNPTGPTGKVFLAPFADVLPNPE